jgi:hypothetical protein
MLTFTRVFVALIVLAFGLFHSEQAKAYWVAPADLIYDDGNDDIAGEAISGRSYMYEGYDWYCVEYNESNPYECVVAVYFYTSTVNASSLKDEYGNEQDSDYQANTFLTTVSQVSKSNPAVIDGPWTHEASHNLVAIVCLHVWWVIDCESSSPLLLHVASKSAVTGPPIIEFDRPSWFESGYLSAVQNIWLSRDRWQHIQGRHSSDLGSNGAGHFYSGLLNTSTSSGSFYTALMGLILIYEPTNVSYINGGEFLGLRYDLPVPIGVDSGGDPTTQLYVLLKRTTTSGLYQVWTAYPKDP